MNFLAICGSLREGSSNHNLLRAFQRQCPRETVWNLFAINDLPYFDPQLQFSSEVPRSVAHFRALAAKADCIVIATPEYAHGIPGILKNALEWLVCEETMKKSVAVLIGTSSGGEYVRQYLAETLRTMDLILPESAILTVRSARQHISAEGEVSDENLAREIQNFTNQILK
jgi:NAD(P)H-dependent FMN reductase